MLLSRKKGSPRPRRRRRSARKPREEGYHRDKSHAQTPGRRAAALKVEINAHPNTEFNTVLKYALRMRLSPKLTPII